MSMEQMNLPGNNLEHRTMQQIVVDRLQQGIRQGLLLPGRKLVYSEIARELNVSITPVREAMKALEAQGLVTITPHRTALVTFLTDDQVGELYAMRALLEGMATQLAVEHMTHKELLHLKRVYKELETVVGALNSNAAEAARSEYIVSLQRLHDDFHLSLYAPCGNKYLLQMIQLLRGQVTTYFPVINRYHMKRVNRSQRQHLAILTACEERKPTLAASLMRNHLRQQIAVLTRHIEANSSDGKSAGDAKDQMDDSVRSGLRQDKGSAVPASTNGVSGGRRTR